MISKRLFEETLENLTDEPLSERQQERLYELIRPPHSLGDALEIVTELTEEQEQLLNVLVAKGHKADEAWEIVCTHDPL